MPQPALCRLLIHRVCLIPWPVDLWHQPLAGFRRWLASRCEQPAPPVEIVPDWHLVAEEWDAVHLSFAGSVMATFVGIEQGGQRARLWAWTTESTVWLRNVFTGWTELEPLLSRPQKTLYTGRFENDLRGSITDDSSTRLRRIRWWQPHRRRFRRSVVFGTVGLGVRRVAGNWRALRRSLLTCAPDGPATSLINRDASQLTSPVQAMEEELEMLRSGVAALFHDTTPVPPRANAQLRRFCADLGRLLAASSVGVP